MNPLTDRQSDSLNELINISFSRTAGSLSELTGHRVVLDPPNVMVCPVSELTGVLSGYIEGDIASVHQLFSGVVSGDALLVLSSQGAAMLVDLLTDSPAPAVRLDASAREVLTEVGNILLNSCLGVFGNLLQVHVSFSVPRLHLEALEALIDSLVIARNELRYALVASTAFRLRDSTVTGHLVLVLGVSSLEQLIESVEKLG